MSRLKRWKLQMQAEKLGMTAGYIINVSAIPTKMTPLEIMNAYNQGQPFFKST